MPYLTQPVLPAGTLAARAQPVIPAGDGLLLRPWRPEDAPAVHAAFQDPALQRWHVRTADSVCEAAEWIEEWRGAWKREQSAQWAVVDADGDGLRGRVALRDIVLADGVAEVAYWTTAVFRSRGVAARAASALAEWAFGEIGFHRLELLHSTANTASCRVAAKAGFILEGTKRAAGLHADHWHDMHLHARLWHD